MSPSLEGTPEAPYQESPGGGGLSTGLDPLCEGVEGDMSPFVPLGVERPYDPRLIPVGLLHIARISPVLGAICPRCSRYQGHIANKVADIHKKSLAVRLPSKSY